MTAPGSRPQCAATPSWQECLDAGMNPEEAAAARGLSLSAAYMWAHRNNVRFRRHGFFRRPKKVRAQVLLDQDLFDAIDAEAKDRGVSRSTYLAALIVLGREIGGPE